MPGDEWLRMRPSAVLRMERPCKWVKANEVAVTSGWRTGSGSYAPRGPAAHCQQVAAAAEESLEHARHFIQEYARALHGLSLEQMNEKWKSMFISWLYTPEEVPKQLGERVDDEYFYHTEMDQELLKVSTLLQRHAVALEQMVWNQEKEREEMADDWEELESGLLCVLCDVQRAIEARRLIPPQPESRELMTWGCRQMQYPLSQMRDWLILRHYVNLLEYIAQVFSRLQGIPQKRR